MQSEPLSFADQGLLLELSINVLWVFFVLRNCSSHKCSLRNASPTFPVCLSGGWHIYIAGRIDIQSYRQSPIATYSNSFLYLRKQPFRLMAESIELLSQTKHTRIESSSTLHVFRDFGYPFSCSSSRPVFF